MPHMPRFKNRLNSVRFTCWNFVKNFHLIDSSSQGFVLFIWTHSYLKKGTLYKRPHYISVRIP